VEAIQSNLTLVVQVIHRHMVESYGVEAREEPVRQLPSDVGGQKWPVRRHRPPV